MEKISSYDCRYKKQFNARGHFGGSDLLTARQKLSRLIDSSWFYSHHWPYEHNSFLDRAQDDLNTEITHARNRLKNLEEAQRILSAIERESEEEYDEA